MVDEHLNEVEQAHDVDGEVAQNSGRLSKWPIRRGNHVVRRHLLLICRKTALS
jgi:hypothetical protein